MNTQLKHAHKQLLELTEQLNQIDNLLQETFEDDNYPGSARCDDAFDALRKMRLVIAKQIK